MHELTQIKSWVLKMQVFLQKENFWTFPNTSVSKTTLTWILYLRAATLPTDYLLMIYASFQKPEQAGTNQAKRENWIPEGITTEIPITLMRSPGAGRPIKPLASLDYCITIRLGLIVRRAKGTRLILYCKLPRSKRAFAL